MEVEQQIQRVVNKSTESLQMFQAMSDCTESLFHAS